ncbi:MAG: HdeD family acid-resistance protein [Erythrobacter sp.]
MNQNTNLMPETSADRGWFIALGVLLVLTGTGALLFPMVMTLSINILVGVTLLVGGGFTAVHAFRLKGWEGFALELLLALVYIAGGLLFLFNPLAGVFTLTVLLGAFFAADGAGRIILALKIKPDRSWSLFLISGLLSLALGIVVLIGLPSGTSLAVLGILVGINMILAGMSFLFASGRSALNQS